MSNKEDFSRYEIPKFDSLEASIKDRLLRRSSLTVSYEKLFYANETIFGRSNYDSALFVGVGHGHDALVQLLLNRIQTVDGVDPFYPEDGNDDADYTALLAVVEDLDLQTRFNVFKDEIQSFLKKPSRTYDLIVLPDVLHHIFVTENRLDRTDLFEHCVKLFRQLASVSRENGTLIISDAPRTGLRCMLSNYGLIKSAVNYRTKQAANQWVSAAKLAGWKFEYTKAYAPYVLRFVAHLIDVPPLPWFYSNHYHSRLRKASLGYK